MTSEGSLLCAQVVPGANVRYINKNIIIKVNISNNYILLLVKQH